MKIVSIDVGIKNLAICVIETIETIETIDLTINAYKNFKIIYWNIINLSENKKYCNCSTTTKKSLKQCIKPALFFKDDKLFCKIHAKNSNYLLPETINKYKSLKLDALINLCEQYNIKYDEVTKSALIKTIEIYIEKNCLLSLQKLNCNTINLIEIGKSIKSNLDNLNETTNLFMNIDSILIENQIGPIANRMNSIQGMLTQYFIMKDIYNIKYVSASNKLKNLIEKNTTYSERKKQSILIAKDILIKKNIDKKYIEFFESHSKKDDLADSLLQAVWFIKEN
jgi:hypothetical protein